MFGNGTVVSAGFNHSIALLQNGECWAWGYNAHGQLGIGNTKEQSSPVKVPLAGKAIAVSAGHNHSIVVLENGECWAWGNIGHLVIGNTTNQSSPVKVPLAEKLSQIMPMCSAIHAKETGNEAEAGRDIEEMIHCLQVR